MQNRSFFADEIMWDGETWVRIFDPADPMGVVPDLRGGVLRKQTVTQVALPNRKEEFYLLLSEIELPSIISNGSAIPAKHLMGFRLYERRPEQADINVIRNSDLVYYIRRPSTASQGGTAQQFLDTVLGSTIAEAERRAAADRAWSKTLFNGAGSEQGTGTTSGGDKSGPHSGSVSDSGKTPA